jgi:DNA-binding response OmpR family regulator
MSAVSRLLVVEGDPVLREILVEQLAAISEFDVAAFERAELGLARVRDDAVDAIVTDSVLPDMDGRTFVETIRDDGFRGPVVMLTSTPDEDIDADLGANDYVAKPFRFAQLLAKLRAQMRAFEAAEEAVVAIGPYTFRAGAKTLTSEEGGLLRLTEKEVAILRFLHRAGEGTVGRDVLLQQVWGYNAAVTTHTLETHIYRLRQKIEIDPSDARILVTEPGGYRLHC